MKCYCVHCRKQTDSDHLENVKTKSGNRTYTKCRCKECGKVKSTFKKNQQGDGLFSKNPNVINLPGEKHIHGNFCGPSTNNRVRMDMIKNQNKSLPIDEIDKACMKHDLNYVKLRRMKKAGMDKDEIRQLTRKVDDVFIKDVGKAKGNPFKKAMIKTAFKGKKMTENITKNPLFVGEDDGRDPTIQQYPNTQLDLSGSGRRKKQMGRGLIRI